MSDTITGDMIPEAVEEVKEVKSAIKAIALDKKGRIVPKDNSEFLRYCKALMAASPPKHLKTLPEFMGALIYCRQMGFPDFAVREIAHIHGQWSPFGSLPLTLARRTGEITYFKESWFDKDYKIISFENQNLTNPVWGAVCWIGRNNQDPNSFSFTVDMAKSKGLYPAMKRDYTTKKMVENPEGPWSKWTELMLRYKARSWGLKSEFADALNGAPIAEYDFERLPENEREVKEVKHSFDGKLATADDINKEFGDTEKGEAE